MREAMIFIVLISLASCVTVSQRVDPDFDENTRRYWIYLNNPINDGKNGFIGCTNKRLGDGLWLRNLGEIDIRINDPQIKDFKIEISATANPRSIFTEIPEDLLARMKYSKGYLISYTELYNYGLVFHERMIRIQSDSLGLSVLLRLDNQVAFLDKLKYPVLYVFNGSMNSFALTNFSPSISLEAVKLNLPFKNAQFFSLDGLVSITQSLGDSSRYNLAVGYYFDFGGWFQVGSLFNGEAEYKFVAILGFRPDVFVDNIGILAKKN